MQIYKSEMNHISLYKETITIHLVKSLLKHIHESHQRPTTPRNWQLNSQCVETERARKRQEQI